MWAQSLGAKRSTVTPLMVSPAKIHRRFTSSATIDPSNATKAHCCFDRLSDLFRPETAAVRSMVGIWYHMAQFEPCIAFKLLGTSRSMYLLLYEIFIFTHGIPIPMRFTYSIHPSWVASPPPPSSSPVISSLTDNCPVHGYNNGPTHKTFNRTPPLHLINYHGPSELTVTPSMYVYLHTESCQWLNEVPFTDDRDRKVRHINTIDRILCYLNSFTKLKTLIITCTYDRYPVHRLSEVFVFQHASTFNDLQIISLHPRYRPLVARPSEATLALIPCCAGMCRMPYPTSLDIHRIFKQRQTMKALDHALSKVPPLNDFDFGYGGFCAMQEILPERTYQCQHCYLEYHQGCVSEKQIGCCTACVSKLGDKPSMTFDILSNNSTDN